jgi:hemerythrin-like domain-containing protein
MIRAAKTRLEDIQAGKKVDSAFIERFIHFIRAYADLCHHGKEEDILFRELAKKKIRPEHKRILEELLEEHKFGRQITSTLAEASRRYQKGDSESLAVLTEGLRTLLDFYPVHIKKEDKNFFLPIMDYFSPEEKDSMIRKGYELDSRLLHREYESLVGLDDATA